MGSCLHLDAMGYFQMLEIGMELALSPVALNISVMPIDKLC